MKVLIGLFVLSAVALAQFDVGGLNNASSDALRQNGRLVSIQLSLGDPIRIFVVGNQVASLDLSNLDLVALQLKPSSTRTLQVARHTHFFTIVEPIDLKTPTILQIEVKIKDEREILQFKIGNQKP